MRKTLSAAALLALGIFMAAPAQSADTYIENLKNKPEPADCFESREGYSSVTRTEATPGSPNVKCSNKTGGVLWWGDPYDGTEPMGEMPVEADYTHEEAVVKPRTGQLKYFMPCTACHNGSTVPYPTSKNPRPLAMHQDIVADSMDLQHGRGAIWCLDCHNPRNRDTLIDHRGGEISFNQPQKLCGKCHGEVYSDWRDGIHGKR
ncbi:MAG TPA: cytochrome c3 family protein, partial [Thermodesulfobacteriota bacterium]